MRVAIHALVALDQVQCPHCADRRKNRASFFRSSRPYPRRTYLRPTCRSSRPSRWARRSLGWLRPSVQIWRHAWSRSKNMNTRSGGLKNLKRLREKQDAWNPGRIAFQNRIIPAGLALWGRNRVSLHRISLSPRASSEGALCSASRRFPGRGCWRKIPTFRTGHEGRREPKHCSLPPAIAGWASARESAQAEQVSPPASQSTSIVTRCGFAF